MGSLWVQKLGLRLHPEGGWFRETYRSKGRAGRRALCTAIYYLLENGQFSAFHRLKSDEIWYFHAGGPLKIHLLGVRPRVIELGKKQFQAVIPAGTWFAAAPSPKFPYSLVSCSVSPGFEFSNFELGRREKLVKRFPKHRKLIERFTRLK